MSMRFTGLPAHSGPAAFHRPTGLFGGLSWRPALLLPEGDAHDDGGSDDGADSAADDGASDDSDGGDQGDDDGADALGDKGKQALDRMKQQRNAARDQLKAFKALGMTAEQIKALVDKGKPGDGDQPDADAIRREVETEAAKKAARRILRSEIKAAAAGKLTDPADAFQFLDLDEFEVDDDGNVDEDEIAEAIENLLSKKPYLAVQDGKRFKGSADGGARKGSRPKQLTRADLAGMTPQQIDAAHKAGQLDSLLKS
jgi:hypothetical protein